MSLSGYKLVNAFSVLFCLFSWSALALSKKYYTQPEQQLNNIPIYSGSYGEIKQKGLRLLRQKDQRSEVVAVIITIHSGTTYDNLFSQVEQKSKEGTQVLVYACNAQYLPKLVKAFQNNPQDAQSKQMMEYVNGIDEDCVVFNWECSSGYFAKTFPEGERLLFTFLNAIIKKGHMAMFSDFSLKALIKQWKDEYGLGPNILKQIGQTSSPFQLRFNESQLTQCPSSQLRMVGQIAEGGNIHVNVMSGTIVYSIDHTKLKNQFYEAQILTVVTSIKSDQEKYKCIIDGHQGTAGHVLFKFKSGGYILTSMGHWVQLMKIDTSEKRLFEVAEKYYGFKQATKMRFQYDKMGAEQQGQYLKGNAAKFVQNQAPSANMAIKHKKKQKK